MENPGFIPRIVYVVVTPDSEFLGGMKVDRVPFSFPGLFCTVVENG